MRYETKSRFFVVAKPTYETRVTKWTTSVRRRAALRNESYQTRGECSAQTGVTERELPMSYETEPLQIPQPFRISSVSAFSPIFTRLLRSFGNSHFVSHFGNSHFVSHSRQVRKRTLCSFGKACIMVQV